jgi:hypothetical protein
VDTLWRFYIAGNAHVSKYWYYSSHETI